MATEVIMPKVDMVMETGTFGLWLKKEGEQVKKGEPLFEISSDKSTIELESPGDGILAGVTAGPGDVIPVTQIIAFILAPGEALPVKAAPQPTTAVEAPAIGSIPQAAVVDVISGEQGKVRATPLARRMARDLQVDLGLLEGSGARGRIHKVDVLAYQKTQPFVDTLSTSDVQAPATQAFQRMTLPVVSANTIPLTNARRKQVVPLTGARKIIAERLSYSAFTAPHINLSLRVDMTETIRLRERVIEPIKAQNGHRVTYTAILARAVVSVLPRHPYLNASISDDSIILWDDIHLGIATSLDNNLIVPVIHEAQHQNLGQIATTLADLTERARNRRLKPSEMTGSTFTISNLGMYGIESFTAIVNPPEAAILAVGKIVETPVGYDGQIVLRPLMELTACADHRIADGETVARFLADLKTTLENPYLLI